jgi:hypothetical protein
MPKRSLIKTLLYLFQLMNMEKLQGVPHSKNDFQALSFRENNKAINRQLSRKIRKYFKRNTNSDYKIDNLSNLEKNYRIFHIFNR